MNENSTSTPDGTGCATAGGDDWRCPMCRCAVIRPHRPGRARVYCTNACRQQAYRWRLRRRDRLRVAQPPQRARTYDRTHALRADDDLVTPLIDGSGRRVTACGTFAMAARDNPRIHRHVRFFSVTNVDQRTGVARASSSTCQRCTDLLGVPRRPIEQVLAEIDQSW